MLLATIAGLLFLCLAALVVLLDSRLGWSAGEKKSAASTRTPDLRGADVSASADRSSEAVDLVLATAEFQNDDSLRRIIGVVRNVSGSEYRNVRIRFRLTNQAGQTIGYAQDSAKILEPFGSFDVQTTAIPKEASRFFLTELEGTRK